MCELLPHCASACEEFLCSSAVVDPVTDGGEWSDYGRAAARLLDRARARWRRSSSRSSSTRREL